MTPITHCDVVKQGKVLAPVEKWWYSVGEHLRANKMRKYKIDLAVVLMMIATTTDVITTFLFVSKGVGIEANLVLAQLIEVSIWFIPIYLFSFVILVPLLPDMLRESIACYFIMSRSLMSVNNAALLLFNNAFILRKISFYKVEALTILFALLLFCYLVHKNNLSKKQIITLMLRGSLFGLFLGILTGSYFLLNYLF